MATLAEGIRYDICVTSEDPRPVWNIGMPSRFTGNDLVCIRGERTVFEGLSFSIGKSDAVVLRGPNGSGKSTLLRLMAGLLHPDSGVLTWNEQDISQDIHLHGANIHYVGHQDAVKPLLTVAENLSFAASLKTPEFNHRIALEAFALVDLADLPVRLLSAGQRRRLALSRLVASQAPLWLLDEPTVSLDEDGVTMLLSAISAHRAGGGMVVAAVHGPLNLQDTSELDVGAFATTGSVGLEDMSI